MSIIDTIKAKAKADVKHIVLPEGSEERTVQAARLINRSGHRQGYPYRQKRGYQGCRCQVRR